MMGSTSFHIEPYTPRYRASIGALIKRLTDWFTEDAMQSIADDLGGDSTAVALDRAGQIMGFIVVALEHENDGRIRWAGVDPVWHRKGVGRALVEYVIAEAAASKLDCLWVETMSRRVDYEPFERTRAFYAALGFEPFEELGDRAGNGLHTTDWVRRVEMESMA